MLNRTCPSLPGIDNPTSQNQFPIINTLLSIPFSLLHTLPHLAGIVPISTHQQQLITMGAKITRLWWWDPSPDMIKNSWEICIQNVVAKQHDDTQKAKPDPIHHQSHGDTTFLTMQPTITYCTHTHTLLATISTRTHAPLTLPQARFYLAGFPGTATGYFSHPGMKVQQKWRMCSM